MMDKLEKQLANLARQKQTARRRGDYNFYRISAEHKAMKARIKKALDDE